MPKEKTKGPEPLKAMPALFDHCVNTYKAMLDQASVVPVEGQEMAVYDGKLTDLISNQLHLSIPYYTSVTRCLKAMGCIRQLRRGGGSSTSQWELKREPTRDLYDSFQTGKPAKPKGTSRLDNLDQRLTALTTRVNEQDILIESLLPKES